MGVSHKETFFCNGKHQIEDQFRFGIQNISLLEEEGHGNVDMTKAIKVSCDVYFIKLQEE